MLEEEKLGGTEEDSPELAGSEGAASKQLPGKPPVTALSKEEVELKKLVAEAEVAELKRDHLRYETDHPHVTFFRTWGPLGSAAIGFFGLMLVTAITQVSSCQSRQFDFEQDSLRQQIMRLAEWGESQPVLNETIGRLLRDNPTFITTRDAQGTISRRLSLHLLQQALEETDSANLQVGIASTLRYFGFDAIPLGEAIIKSTHYAPRARVVAYLSLGGEFLEDTPIPDEFFEALAEDPFLLDWFSSDILGGPRVPEYLLLATVRQELANGFPSVSNLYSHPAMSDRTFEEIWEEARRRQSEGSSLLASGLASCVVARRVTKWRGSAWSGRLQGRPSGRLFLRFQRVPHLLRLD